MDSGGYDEGATSVGDVDIEEGYAYMAAQDIQKVLII